VLLNNRENMIQNILSLNANLLQSMVRLENVTNNTYHIIIFSNFTK